MPIRPEQRPLYPPPREWRELRARILERAGHACECRGECGVAHARRCGAANGALVLRRISGGVELVVAHHCGTCCLGETCTAVEGTPVVRVVLTISHRDHDPTNNDPSNLAALCQRCHLRYDRAHHAETRRATRDARTGQRRLVP